MPSTAKTETVDAIPLVKPGMDDLSRNVFGVLGLPIDAIDFPMLLQSMEAATANASPFLISTPNVNFLVASQHAREFRESMLMSSLCLADGMPLIWISKLLRIPINERIAGSDLFGRLKSTHGKARRLKVFLLGGAEGLGAIVRKKINAQNCGMECVGELNPGFGTIEEMSTKPVIDAINASGADLLAVFFGAAKAQAWLMHNHHRLQPPLRAQFGATINFEAGTVKRAPLFMRSTGFEWLWRIKEEPYLWRRYWSDGRALLLLLLTNVLPLSIRAHWSRGGNEPLVISRKEDSARVTLSLSGDATGVHADQAIAAFRDAIGSNKPVVVDLSNTAAVDPRFFGIFLMLRKQVVGQGGKLTFVGVTPKIRKVFRLNRFEYLLAD